MGYIDVQAVSLTLPDGRPLLDEVSFRVGEGTTSALIGANGAGKSTLLKIIRGEVKPDAGSVQIDGGPGVMDQFVGHLRDESTVRDLLISVAPPRIRAAALALEALLRGPDQVLLLDEPDNYLDVPGKRWLEERLLETRKTVLFVSHDRELLARVAVFASNSRSWLMNRTVLADSRMRCSSQILPGTSR